MAKLVVSDVRVEYIFEWLWNSIIAEEGYGGGAIVCHNYEEAIGYFLDWYKTKYDSEFPLVWYQNPNFPSQQKDNHELFYSDDTNDYLYFTNDPNIHLLKGENIFIVQADCTFDSDSTKVLKAIKENS